MRQSTGEVLLAGAFIYDYSYCQAISLLDLYA